MDSEGSSSGLPGSDNQDSNEPAPPGTVVMNFDKSLSTPVSRSKKLLPSSKGVENAKKRLRAFSIQKKAPITPVQLPKASATGTIGTTVLIGKLSSAKPATPKIEDETKKPAKPPRPGSCKKNFQDSYTELQKRTLAEIEDMKRKMELVDLGIPLGLICPSVNSDKAMPTKAMPPIKTFLDATKVDEIIRDAKKARAEGKEFKFDYSKILPDYDNPFQRKKDDAATQEKEKEETVEKEPKPIYKSIHYTKPIKSDSGSRDKSKRKSDRYDSSRRHSEKYDRSRKDHRSKYKVKRTDKFKDKDKDKSKEKDSKKAEKETKGEMKEPAKSGVANVEQDNKETDVNLNDYLVCDSWSLENDDKTASPQVDDKSVKVSTTINKESKVKEVGDSKEVKKSKEGNESNEATKTKEELEKEALLKAVQSSIPGKKIEKLKPVVDSFEFEIDPNDYDILDEDNKLEEFTTSKTKKNFDFNQDTNMSDSLGDDNFLESVINEIKQENLSDDDSQDKGLVAYDSPILDFKWQGTPELDESMLESQRSDYSDGCRSTESGCRSTESGCRSTESGYKSTESGYKSTESYKSPDRQKREKTHKSKDRAQKASEEKSPQKEKSVERDADLDLSVEKELDEAFERKMSKSTFESLEMWDFVLKICQPLLFRHDKTKCYKQTRAHPSLWWATRAGACGCVRGRPVVLGELRTRRPALVDRVYGTDQISDSPAPKQRCWYPPAEQCLSESVTVTALPPAEGPSPPGADGPRQSPVEGPRQSPAEGLRQPPAEGPHRPSAEAPRQPPAEGPRQPPDGRRGPDTPQRGDSLLLDREYQRFMEAVWPEVAESQAPSRSTTPVRQDAGTEKPKLSSEGWSQESEVEEEPDKSKKQKEGKEKKTRKRKRSSSPLSPTSDDEIKKKKAKKKINKKTKTKLAKRKRMEKKNVKKLKEKQKKKKTKAEKISEEEEIDVPKRKQKDKKLKKKPLKTKKIQKKKKARARSSSSSSSSSSSESEERKKKTKKSKKKKEDAFDVNILNNIKAEKLTDDENCQNMTDQDFSPRRQQEKRPEIINVKELQCDLGVHIKQEVIEEEKEETIKMDDFDLSNNEAFMEESNVEKTEFKEPEEPQHLSPQRADENLSQCSSQESICSEKPPLYEKDESHLRPSSQNSNYSFNDVIASQSGLYNKGIEAGVECDKFEYEQENYEMYEQLAMAYQSDVAANQVPLPSEEGTRRIETVVRLRGEIKCDWRAGVGPKPAATLASRPSRWGLKPGDVNIVLTGAELCARAPPGPVYQIQSLANRQDNSTGSYDEAYMDTYGAMDRLQYGDCFSSLDAQSQQQSHLQTLQQTQQEQEERRSTLDDRIDQALRQTVLGEIAMEPENKENDADAENRDRGILITPRAGRSLKRVTFADGYKPGQDSDTEEPPIKKRRKPRRRGCAWPCPTTHADHVPLWDALPPPPPPPGSPPPPPRAAPPLHLLRDRPPPLPINLQVPPPHKFDPNMPMPGFMPPEPPPGFLALQ